MNEENIKIGAQIKSVYDNVEHKKPEEEQADMFPECQNLELGKRAEEKEWKGMPEFKQDKQMPFKVVIVRFATEADYKDFQQKIKQKLTPVTASIWHPKLQAVDLEKWRYVDEEVNEDII